MLVKREGKKFTSEGLSLRYNTSPNYSNMNLSSPVIEAVRSVNDNQINSNHVGSSDNSSVFSSEDHNVFYLYLYLISLPIMYFRFAV